MFTFLTLLAAALAVGIFMGLWLHERRERIREAATNRATREVIAAIDDEVLRGVLRDAGLPHFESLTGPPDLHVTAGRHRADLDHAEVNA